MHFLILILAPTAIGIEKEVHMLQQGLVLLVAGMGIAIGFLWLLAVVTTGMGKIAGKLNLFPEPAPKKPVAPAQDDAAVAVAIAAAERR